MLSRSGLSRIAGHCARPRPQCHRGRRPAAGGASRRAHGRTGAQRTGTRLVLTARCAISRPWPPAVQRAGTSAKKHAEGPSPHWGDSGAPTPLALVAGLGPSLRSVALLVLAGHNRAEIRHLLRISDVALRQRISGIRRAWSARGDQSPAEFPSLDRCPGFRLHPPLGFCRWCAQAPPISPATIPTPTRSDSEFRGHGLTK